MKTIADLNLNTADKYELKLHIVPPQGSIYCHCIQDVMRDYAELCDWSNANESDESLKDEHAYCVKLMTALGKRIKSAMSGTY